MTPEQLDIIIDGSLPKLRAVMGELHPRILEAVAAALEATQDTDDGGKPKVAISLKLGINLNGKTPKWRVEGGVSVKYKSVSEIEEVDETPELVRAINDLRAAGVMISAGGKS